MKDGQIHFYADLYVICAMRGHISFIHIQSINASTIFTTDEYEVYIFNSFIPGVCFQYSRFCMVQTSAHL